MKTFQVVSLALLQAAVSAQDVFQCKICGDGNVVTNPEGIVVVPNPDIENQPCVDFEFEADSGVLTEELCASIQLLALEPCGCLPEVQVTAAPTNSPAPTTTSSSSPTFGPQPDCFTDLDEISLRDSETTDLNVARVYVLCPNTDFKIATSLPDSETGFVGGFQPLGVRTNAEVRCGSDGSSSNNCRLVGGSFASVILSFDVSVNITFAGMTFDSQLESAVLIGMPGSMTFNDCIFRNQENIGAIRITYAGGFRRSLEQGDGTSHADVKGDEIANVIDKRHNERMLQVPTPTLPLKVVFNKCMFENNTAIPPGDFARPGIITSESTLVSMEFYGCIFQDNMFGDSSVTPTSWAIYSLGPLVMKDNCFVNSPFLRQAPVVSAGDVSIVAENNYVDTTDENVVCQLIAHFSSTGDIEGLTNVTCYEPDTMECLALTGMDPNTSPSESPTQDASCGLSNASPFFAITILAGIHACSNWIVFG